MDFFTCNIITDETGYELTQHGSLQFPIACYQDDLLREPVPWHWHDELEVAIIVNGSLQLAIGSQQYQLHAGTGFFINAGVFHGAWHREGSSCEIHSLVFHPRLIGGAMDSIFWQKYIKPLTTNTSLEGIIFQPETEWQNIAIRFIETAWENCFHETPGYEFTVRSDLSQLLYLILTHSPTNNIPLSTKKQLDTTRIKTMLQYIYEHYSEDISVHQLAKSASISESECLRCFRKHIATSPIQYVKQYRIQKATELLISTNEKISDIGNSCGFSDISYFTKTFRQMKGVTPKEYRLRNQS